MAATVSTMRDLGTPLPSFNLLDPRQGSHVSDEVLRSSRVSVVAFICNHCPFVVHLRKELAEFGRVCAESGVPMVAISSNDALRYPQDGPELMAQEAAEQGYPFPYLYDAEQTVARSFDAACTPDFFVYDSEAKLAYRGQFDASRPGNGVPVTGSDLRAAVIALLGGKRPSAEQRPSIGCSIKWKAAG